MTKFGLECWTILQQIVGMKSILQLDKMSREEKLQAMEELWRDLSRDENDLESPGWHGDELKAREQRVEEGNDEYVPWNQAKKDLRDRQ